MQSCIAYSTPLHPPIKCARYLFGGGRSTVVLAGSLLQTGVVLLVAGDGIIGDTTKAILALAASSANRADRSGLTECAAALARGRDISGLAAGADVDGAGVRGVEVGGHGGLLGERQVRLNLVDGRGVGLHVGGGGGVALLRGNHFDCVWL